MGNSKVDYHHFRLKEVEIKKNRVRFAVKWEQNYEANEHHGDYHEVCIKESLLACNTKLKIIMDKMVKFLELQDEQNTEVVKIKVWDLIDFMEEVQFVYETDKGDEKPHKTRTSKMEVRRFGDLTKELEQTLEELRLCCWEFCVNGTHFASPNSGEVKINTLTGEIS